MTVWPLVSVIVPSFNHAPFLKECLDSVFAQDYPAFEVIVIDDGSSDNSGEVLRKLQDQFPFKMVLREHRGLSNTVNQAILEFATGKYISITASDDCWLPGKLSKQVRFMEENPEFPMAYGKSKVIDVDGQYLERQTATLNAELKGGSIFREIFLMDFHPPVNYIYRAEVIRSLGLFDERSWVADFDMNLRIAEKYPIGFQDEFMDCYRRGVNSSSWNDPVNIIRSHRYSIDKFKTSPWYREAVRRWHYRRFIWLAGKKGHKWPAFKSMLASVKFCSRKTWLKAVRNLIFR